MIHGCTNPVQFETGGAVALAPCGMCLACAKRALTAQQQEAATERAAEEEKVQAEIAEAVKVADAVKAIEAASAYVPDPGFLVAVQVTLDYDGNPQTAAVSVCGSAAGTYYLSSGAPNGMRVDSIGEAVELAIKRAGTRALGGH